MKMTELGAPPNCPVAKKTKNDINDFLMIKKGESSTRNIPTSNQTSSNAIRQTKLAANEGRTNMSKSIIVDYNRKAVI